MSIITGPGAYRNEAGERVEIVGGDLSGYWAGTNNDRYCSNGAPCPCHVCDGASPIVGPWVAPAYLDAGAASFAGLEARKHRWRMSLIENHWFCDSCGKTIQAPVLPETAPDCPGEAANCGPCETLRRERDEALTERDTARAARARAQQHLQEVTAERDAARQEARRLLERLGAKIGETDEHLATALEAVKQRDAALAKLAAVRAAAGEGA